MKEPPLVIDDARVFKWAWSGQIPFGYVVDINDPNNRDAIFGLAICSYDDGLTFYRFSCDINWEVVQDSFYNSIENAVDLLPEQYRNVVASWHSR